VRDNPDDFPPQKQGAKYDFSINQAVDLNKGKKKNQLEPYQVAHAQALVIKKFSRIRRDIIINDDQEAITNLEELLVKVRQEEVNTEDKLYQKLPS